MKIHRIVALALVPCCLPACAHFEAKPSDRLRAANDLQGAYQPAMQSVASLPGNPAKIQLVPVSSPGSKVTLQQIGSGRVDIGIAQADSNLTGSGAIAVRSMYDEVFFIISRTPASSLSELAGHIKDRKLRLGGLPKGSQTEIDCRRILAADRIQNAVYVGGDHKESLQRLKTGAIDGAFMITGPESRTLDVIRNDRSLHLVPITSAPWKGVAYTTLPAGAVLRHALAIETLYTPSVLFASSTSPAGLVTNLANALDKNKAAIHAKAPFVHIARVPASLDLPKADAAR